ncbi:MAG TPA: hypothetical protein VF821_19445 [Lentzea sp.]
MTHLALVGPPHLTGPRVPAGPGVYRIGRGESQAAVSFDPADERRRQNLLTWFERGGEPGATLLIDDWKLCAESDPGLVESVRWIAATAREVTVIITARSVDVLPARVPLRVEVLDFLSLHGLLEFTRALAWHGRWWKVPIGVSSDGTPVVVELTHFVDGKWRTGSHLSITAPEAFRSLVLGLMTTHSPKLFQAIFIDARATDVFAGLDQAPHVQAHHRNVAGDPTRVREIADGLRQESERRLELVGNSWTIFAHRDELDEVLPQLLVCVSGVDEIIAVDPEFSTVLTEIAGEVGRSGVQLLLDSPHDTIDLRVDDCVAPADLDSATGSLPPLMRQAAVPLDFHTLHEAPRRFSAEHAWRQRPLRDQYCTPLGTDEYGIPVHLDIKPNVEQSGMGAHGQIVAPAERRAECLRAILLGLMSRHSPEDLQIVLIDFHENGVFAGLDSAPHVQNALSILDDFDHRAHVLRESGHRTTWHHRGTRVNHPDMEPLSQLLVCVDGVNGLLDAQPEFLRVLQQLGRVGRSYGQHLLLSESTWLDAPMGVFCSYHLELTDDGWARRVGQSVERFALPPDLDDVARSLPQAMRAETARNS